MKQLASKSNYAPDEFFNVIIAFLVVTILYPPYLLFDFIRISTQSTIKIAQDFTRKH